MDRDRLIHYACAKIYGRGKAGASVMVDDTVEMDTVEEALREAIRVVAVFDDESFRSKLLQKGISAEKIDRYSQNVYFYDDTYGSAVDT